MSRGFLLAERARFELARGFIPCLVSSEVLSATQPPLQTGNYYFTLFLYFFKCGLNEVVLCYNQGVNMKKILFKGLIVVLLTLGGLFFYAGKTSEFYLSEIRKFIGENKIIAPLAEIKLPEAEGEKEVTFDWKYKNQKYNLSEKLYDSYFKFYEDLPAELIFRGESEREWQAKNNALFLRDIAGDNTLPDLVAKIKLLGEQKKLTENQVAELTVAFVQTIPYDYAELEEIARGEGEIDYPYEVLYENKGICSDKSFLAYALLKNLGYGVSLFLFAEDRHMAVGLKCPVEYSDYASGYCFVETTSLGNRIGVIPEILPQNRIALANQEIGAFGASENENEAQPLGKVEILNEIDGKIYTGIIDTFNTQKEIDSLKVTLEAKNRELQKALIEIKEKEAYFEKTEKKLKSLSRDENYEKYNDLVEEYNKKLSAYKKELKSYNQDVAAYNKLTNRYNQLIKSF